MIINMVKKSNALVNSCNVNVLEIYYYFEKNYCSSLQSLPLKMLIRFFFKKYLNGWSHHINGSSLGGPPPQILPEIIKLNK